MITLDGIVEQIVYHSETTHYSVLRIKTGAGDKPVTAVGYLSGAAAGQAVRLCGQWSVHPRYGQQFKFSAAEATRPATVEGIRQYLNSGIFKGIGPATAGKIIAAFGTETLDILDDEPHRLQEVAGIGACRAEAIIEQWQGRKVISEIMDILQQHGIRAAYGAKIYSTYGDEAIDIIRHAPYRIAEDISGIGFYIADALGRKMGMAADAPKRAEACVEHLLSEAAAAGHVYMLHDDLLGRMGKAFEIPSDVAADAVSALAENHSLIIEDVPDGSGRAIFSAPLYQAERGIARRLAALMSVPPGPRGAPASTEALAASLEDRFVIRFSDQQVHALEMVLGCRAAVITGGPGTGKTTLIRTIAEAFRQLGDRVCLAAPTGRAARRLSEVTLKPAHTLHKLLGYNFENATFEKDCDNPIDADVLIVDEASMIDAPLMHHLICAVRLNARLILVGDVFQLPPVGPGNVLADIIASNTVPVCRLTEIFRQADRSPIVINAHRVREGILPDLHPFAPDRDNPAEFCFIPADTPEAITDEIISLCTSALPEAFGLDPVADIQILSPVHKGIAGTIDLNSRLQAALNGSGASLAGIHHTFRSGDRVMHLKNNYRKEVFNGDIGVITAVDPAENTLTVDFYGRSVDYLPEDIDELTLGYAISVHKSQGSEYPAIILPLTTRHYMMLQRNLLYTAITRARRLVILVGTEKALATAIKKDTPQQRLTGLAHHLRACCGETLYASHF